MLTFAATECGSNIESGSVLCGASNSKDKKAEWHALVISREVHGGDPEEDWGPYFELDDQSQGFYTRTAKVWFKGAVMTVEVSGPAKQRFGHRKIVVDLTRCRAKEISQLKKGLRIVFRDAQARLRDV